MATFLLANAGIVVTLLAIVSVLLLSPHRRRTVAIQERSRPGLATLRRRTGAARWIGLALGFAAFWWVAGLGSSGRGLMMAPVLAATVTVGCLTVGDLLAHGSARGTHAGVIARATGVWPRALGAAVVTVALTLLVALALATALAGNDEPGMPEHALTWHDASGQAVGAVSPWPGAYYAGPLTCALASLAVVTAVALAVMARRPRDDSDEHTVAVDDWIRRREGESVVAAAGFGVAFAGLGVFAIITEALHSAIVSAHLNGQSTPAEPWPEVAAWMAAGLAIASAGLLVVCAVLLVVPGARRRRGQRTATLLAAEAA